MSENKVQRLYDIDTYGELYGINPKTVSDAVTVKFADSEETWTLSEFLKKIQNSGYDFDTVYKDMKEYFLLKKENDSVESIPTFESDTVTNGTAHFNGDISGANGYNSDESWSLTYNENGESLLSVDNLDVKTRAIFHELTIEKMNAVGGALVLSVANGRITDVEVQTDGNFKCTLEVGENTNGTYEKPNRFAAGDYVRCQVFTGSGTHYYWRRIEEVGDDYVILKGGETGDPQYEVATGSENPQAGDDIVQLGHYYADDYTGTKDRQSAIIIASYDGSNGPYIKLYEDINTMSLVGRDSVRLSTKEGNKFSGDLVISNTGANVATEIDKLKNNISEQVAYSIVLENSNTSVAVDSSGIVKGGFPSCKVHILHGVNEIDNTTSGYSINVTIAATGCSAMYMDSTASGRVGDVTVSALSEDRAVITVSAEVVTSEGSFTAVPKTITITKATASATGKDAVAWNLKPNATIAVFGTDGVVSPSSLTFKLYKTIGSGSPTEVTENFTVKYSADSGATGSLAPGGALTLVKGMGSVTLTAYDSSSNYLDSETIPVLFNAEGMQTTVSQLVSTSSELKSTISQLSGTVKTHTTQIEQNATSISTVASNFNSDGTLKNTSGLVTSADLTKIYALDNSGQVVNASTLEVAPSSVKISSANIDFAGKAITVSSDNFSVTADGLLKCKNAEIAGTINAGTINGVLELGDDGVIGISDFTTGEYGHGAIKITRSGYSYAFQDDNGFIEAVGELGGSQGQQEEGRSVIYAKRTTTGDAVISAMTLRVNGATKENIALNIPEGNIKGFRLHARHVSADTTLDDQDSVVFVDGDHKITLPTTAEDGQVLKIFGTESFTLVGTTVITALLAPSSTTKVAELVYNATEKKWYGFTNFKYSS